LLLFSWALGMCLCICFFLFSAFKFVSDPGDLPILWASPTILLEDDIPLSYHLPTLSVCLLGYWCWTAAVLHVSACLLFCLYLREVDWVSFCLYATMGEGLHWSLLSSPSSSSRCIFGVVSLLEFYYREVEVEVLVHMLQCASQTYLYYLCSHLLYAYLQKSHSLPALECHTLPEWRRPGLTLGFGGLGPRCYTVPACFYRRMTYYGNLPSCIYHCCLFTAN
jgi:hypothetical protein